MSRSLSLWSQPRGLTNLFDHFFDKSWDRFGDDWSGFPNLDRPPGRFSPAVDVQETDDAYLMNFDLPGVEKENVKIEVKDNQLLVSGERKFEKKEDKGTRHFTERSYGSFQRVFNLPESIKTEKIDAQYEQGVLKLTLPKAEAVKPRLISVK